MMTNEFVFFGPVVGPLNKEDYLGTLGLFKIYEAFPDIEESASKFVQDLEDVNRYWGIIRVQGARKEEFNMGNRKIAPTDNPLLVDPQSVSVTLYEEGLITQVTGGSVVDDRDAETTDVGATLAVDRSVGAPLPRAWPPRILLRFLNWLGAKMKNFPRADLISWNFQQVGQTLWPKPVHTADLWS